MMTCFLVNIPCGSSPCRLPLWQAYSARPVWLCCEPGECPSTGRTDQSLRKRRINKALNKTAPIRWAALDTALLVPRLCLGTHYLEAPPPECSPEPQTSGRPGIEAEPRG